MLGGSHALCLETCIFHFLKQEALFETFCNVREKDENLFTALTEKRAQEIRAS